MDEELSQREQMLQSLLIELEYLSDGDFTALYNQHCTPKKKFLGDGRWEEDNATGQSSDR